VVISSYAAKNATRGRFKTWLEQMRTDPNKQAGLQNAGLAILQGDTINNPWGSLIQGIAGYAQGKRQSEERERTLGIETEERARRQAKEDAQMAMQAEQFELTKKATTAQLAEAEAKREMAEQSRQALAKHIGNLPPEDQALLGPYISDPDKYFQIFDDLGDDRRAAEQFGKTFGETTRHNKVSEANTAASLANERARIKISEEGMNLKSEKQVMKKMGDFIITQDALGREISREALPENPTARRNAALRLIESQGVDPKQAASILAEVDAELNVGPVPGIGGPMVTHRPAAQASGTDEELLAGIQAAREGGLSDDDIMRSLADLPAHERARVLALMRRR
jgi:hypothetical protein